MVRTWTVAYPEPIVVCRPGVVTNVPCRAMCTGPVTVRCTSRWMPLPEYHRLLGIGLVAWRAITFGVFPSVWTWPVRS